tara:strand:+ start:14631 stop:15080 length:450 start_codon:yes stop_codon:yes gene_type:complete
MNLEYDNIDSNVVGDIDSNVTGDIDSNVVGDIDSNVAGDIDSNVVNSVEKNTNYEELDKLRKIIENLNNGHHLEIAKIFKNNNIKLTENNNGIFINLNNISDTIIADIKKYIEFIRFQESLIKIDESKKEKLEKTYFNDTTDQALESDV